MGKLRGVILGLFGADRRLAPRDETDRQDLERRHARVAMRLSRLNGHSAADILADAYREADEILYR